MPDSIARGRFVPPAALALGALCLALASAAFATPFVFSNGPVTDRIAVASRPGTSGLAEIEAADDFILSERTTLTSASFTGLLRSLTGGIPTVGEIVIEIYRVFPQDSTNPPAGKVPTRVNSPSDVALDSRDSATAGLSFTTTTLTGSFTVANSVVNNIFPTPNQTTGGEGALTGSEVEFDINFLNALTLDPGHYFFVPQVQVTGGQFLWLSASRPIVPPGTPFLPDLQGWIRNADLAPDWLRVGTDIVGGTQAPTYNFAFTLAGQSAATTVPEPASLLLVGIGALAGFARRRRAVSARP